MRCTVVQIVPYLSARRSGGFGTENVVDEAVPQLACHANALFYGLHGLGQFVGDLGGEALEVDGAVVVDIDHGGGSMDVGVVAGYSEDLCTHNGLSQLVWYME